MGETGGTEGAGVTREGLVFEGTVPGSVTHGGQVTDLEMIYGRSCDTVLTRPAFTIGLIFPFSPFLLPFSLTFPVSLSLCLSFSFNHHLLGCWILLKHLAVTVRKIDDTESNIAVEKLEWLEGLNKILVHSKKKAKI